MRDAQLGAVVRHIRRLAVPLDTQDVSDVQLLDRFTRQREESAFAALMRRHGGLVWGVCRHVLRQEQDAEDAFQATFLVLAGKAGAIRKREALACWLHGTAYRIAMTARREAMRRKAREAKAAGERPESAPESAWQELQAALDEEVQRLPQRQRAVFVLCALEGKSQAEAAGELGWQLGTVASTLARTRARLRTALARRGITLTAVLAGLAVVGHRAGAAPTALAGATLRAAVVGAAAADLPARVTALARSATQGLSPPVKLVTALVILAVTVGAGAAFRPAPAAPPAPPPPAGSPEDTGRVVGEKPGDEKRGQDTAALESPLPAGAFARLGTSRFRHAHIVAGIAFASDGKFIATGSHMGTVRLWDPATGKELRSWQAHDSGAIGLAISPDGKTVATGSWDNSIRLWDADGKALRTMLGHTSEVSRLAFSPDGKVIASGSKDGTVRLWDPTTGAALSTITAHAREVRGLAFSPDGKRLATSGADKLVYVWDAESGKRLVTCEGHTDEALSVAWSPDGKALASSSKDQTARLWESDSGKLKRTLKHTGWLERVAFSPDGKSLAVAGGWGGKVHLWDLTHEGDKPRWSAPQMNSVGLAFSPDGKRLAGCGWEAGVRVWDVATGKEQGAADAGGHTSWVTALAVAPDGTTVVSASTDWTVIVWDTVRRREVRRLTGHTDRAYSVAVSPDGRTVATGARDKTIRLWDLATGREVKKIEAGGLVHGLTFSPDGKRLASCSGNDTYDGWVLEVPGHNATVWDVATGKPAFRLEGHDGGVKSVAWSPDGKTLATGGNDTTVRLWDAANGKELRRLEGNTKPVESVVFSPDGKRLAAAGQDGVLRVWRTDGDDKPTPIGTDNGRLLGVAFSPDGRSLVTADHWPRAVKSALRVWDVATGKERVRYAGHQGTASAVGFAPDGRVLISGGGDGTILLWDVTGRAENGKFAQAELSPPALESEWANLAGDDMMKVHKSIWALVAAPKQSLPLLREVLKPVPAADADRIAKLIKELDDDDFSVREKASAELEKVGEPAAAALRKALEGTPSAELRVRATMLLDGFGGKGASADVVRRERALEVLEQIGGPEARAVLEELAKGAPEAAQTQRAKEALKRLPR
jgi:RNA polymerase sigma factor (sigma-70 family)